MLAGVRRPATAPEGTEEVLVDVTDPPALRASTRSTGWSTTPASRSPGPLEFLPPDELRRQLEVNVVGQLRMTQRCLPALRAARGRIVNMGSISGLNALPLLGAYAMSKFALEAMTDALRVELAPWGIHVAIVEPGTIKTPIWTRERRAAAGWRRCASYGVRIDAFPEARRRARQRGAPRRAVGRTPWSTRSPRSLAPAYLVGRDAKPARASSASRTAPRPPDRPPRPRLVCPRPDSRTPGLYSSPDLRETKELP